MTVNKLIIVCIVLFFQTVASYDFTIVTPKAFRLGAHENVVLNLHGCEAVDISAYLQELPDRQNLFSQIQQTHYDIQATSQPITLQFRAQPTDFINFRLRQKVVMVIEVTGGGCDFSKEVEVLISQESGYLFVQTDRPTYRPGESVKIRVFPLNQVMSPYSDVVTVIVKTPDGIGIYKRHSNLPMDGFIEAVYPIYENPVFGPWFVEAEYSANGQKLSATAQFVVQRYVLPTFQVQVKLDKNFILSSDDAIIGAITATYSYGQPVTGNYFLSMKVKKTPDSFPVEFYKLPSNFQLTGRIRDGHEQFFAPISHLTNTLQEEESLLTLAANGGSIFIEATVNGDAEGILESVITPDIPFLISPYHIDTSRISNYYTPGLAYKLQADIYDGLKFNKVPMVVVIIITVQRSNGDITPYPSQSDENGQINFQLDFEGNGPQKVTIATADPAVEVTDQASVTFTVIPYSSPSSSFLQVTTENPTAAVDQQNFFVTFSHNKDNVDEIRYYVIARGTVVQSGTNNPIANNRDSTQRIEITQNMVPSARVVAYYFVGTEVVSNSLWIDIVDRCKEELIVTTAEEVLPGTPVNFDIHGSPNALVSISGVDRAAYFLFNGSRLTRKTMFEQMDGYDQGCVRNGGRDGRNVFLAAGLTLTTSTLTATEVNSLECAQISSRKRKRRQADIAPNNLGQLQKCDRDGRLESSDGEDCNTRGKRVLDNSEDSECTRIFIEACMEATRQRLISELSGSVGRSSGDRAAADVNVARQRSDFEESLIFSSVRLDGNGRGFISKRARDSITTFDIDSASMQDANDGFCIANPTELRVFKDIFIQFFVPFSLKVRQQASLKFSVFNYHPKNDYEVTVEIKHGDTFCSHFKPVEWAEVTTLPVLSNGAASSSFTVLPVKIPRGDFGIIELRALLTEDDGSIRVLDNIKKEILIEELGEIQDTFKSYPIDLGRSAVDMEETFDISFNFPELYVPGSRKCWIYAYTNFLGPSIEIDSITKEPNNIASIFRQPYGCGEQNMLVCGPNVYAHDYLQATGKMVPGTQQYDQSVKRMEQGYIREQSFRSDRVNKRAFAVWAHEQPSTWLNAYVDKVFSRAKAFYTDLNVDPICSSLEWLIGEQVATGYFREQRPPYHREMHGAVGGRLTLTAYVMIALVESRSLCPQLNAATNQALTNAFNFLEENQNDPTFAGRPYGLALLSYALSLYDPTSQFAISVNQRLLSHSMTSGDQREIFWRGGQPSDIQGTDIHAYWYEQRPLAVDVEATAYALLAQVEMAKFNAVTQEVLDRTRKIVTWLIKQRNEGGAFISTQDTVIGLQALAAYQKWVDTVDPTVRPTDINLSLRSVPGTVWENGSAYHLDDKDEGFKRTIEVPDDVKNGRTVTVEARGTGEGVISYRCIYRTLVEEESCHFDIQNDVKLLNRFEYENDNLPMRLKLTVTVSKPQGSETGMAIIDIGLLPGFEPVEPTIQRLAISEITDGFVDRYEITKQNVVLYLRRIKRSSISIAFELLQVIPIANPQPSEIKVYDYYEPSVRCGQFYAVPESLPNIRTVNCESSSVGICECAEGGCLKCRSREEQLDNTMCLSDGNCDTCTGSSSCSNLYDMACGSNYVYIVRISNAPTMASDGIFIKFEASIVEILKVGNDPNLNRDSKINFMARNDCYKNCRDPGFEETAKNNNEGGDFVRKDTLMMVYGSTIDSSVDRNGGQMHLYRLDHLSVMERHIPPEKCASTLRNHNRRNLQCGDPNYQRNPAKEARCRKLRKFVQACRNIELLRGELQEGCD